VRTLQERLSEKTLDVNRKEESWNFKMASTKLMICVFSAVVVLAMLAMTNAQSDTTTAGSSTPVTTNTGSTPTGMGGASTTGTTTPKSSGSITLPGFLLAVVGCLISQLFL